MSYGYQNVFERSKNLKTRFSAIWRTRDGEILNVRGTIRRVAGDMFGLGDLEVTLQNGRPAHRDVDGKFFTASSQAGVVAKLREHFSRVDVTHDTDPLKLEMERDQRKRNLESSFTPSRAGKAVTVVEPAQPKLIFGCDPNDEESLGRLFNQAFQSWAFEHKDLAEYQDAGKTPEQIAQAQRDLQQNVRSMAELVFYWGRTGKIKVLDVQALTDAEVYLKNTHHWFGGRRRGEPMPTAFVAPVEQVVEKPAEVDPRKLSFEELQRIEKARQARVKREKGLRDDVNSLGSVR